MDLRKDLELPGRRRTGVKGVDVTDTGRRSSSGGPVCWTPCREAASVQDLVLPVMIQQLLLSLDSSRIDASPSAGQETLTSLFDACSFSWFASGPRLI